jgi:hypothetical protein
MLAKENQGRPRVIPSQLIPELLQHRQQGLSWEELARWLRNTHAVDCSRWAVRRACLGMGVYKESNL